jgi:hypothetical protein
MAIFGDQPEESLVETLLGQTPQVPDFGGGFKGKVFSAATGQSDIDLNHRTKQVVNPQNVVQHKVF